MSNIGNSNLDRHTLTLTFDAILYILHFASSRLFAMSTSGPARRCETHPES